jgi:4-aminobutyrate aminotransferase-like enzyme
VAYADRLVELFPGDLNVVMFTNSGSEANDLAWRMARTVTDREGLIVTRHAYHGSTALTMATSPEEVGHGTLEPWVATVPAPDHRIPLDGSIEQAIQHLAGHGHRPAALAFDTVFSSDGIFEPPDGYFRSAAEVVRESGGLFIADEVQAGFGRVGTRLWGFADHDFVPDIVTLGKPMGNGHPIAAVVTTPAIAEEFTRLGYYFSTFAGNPVSTAAAMAVLDVMEAEQLPARAERVGSYLRAGLRELTKAHPSISDVRGPGLFMGVELSAGSQPDPERARLVVNEMRLRRILIGRTGLYGNVLKIRPPLAFDESNADVLLKTLSEVLDLTQE